MLKIRLQKPRSFEPGEVIEIGVEWSLADVPTAVELRVVWNTSGKGDVDFGVARTVCLDNPAVHDSRQVSLTLPSRLYSFSGRLLSLSWGLELVALPSNESIRKDIIIGPGRHEVILHKDEHAGS